MIRATTASLLLASLVLIPAQSHAQAINLLTEDAFPFQYLEDKKPVGMAVDVVAEMFRRAAIPNKNELLAWSAAYDRAQLYPNTCVYSTARTANRERLFKWIGPIVENKWAAFARKGFKGSLSRPEDLKQYRVGVLKGDAKERYLKDLAVTFRAAEADDAANPAKLTLNRSEPDKIDLWVTGYYTGRHIAAKAGVKDIVPVWIFERSENYLACHPGLAPGTAEKLQKALDAMKRDGTHAAIVSRYESGSSAP